MQRAQAFSWKWEESSGFEFELRIVRSGAFKFSNLSLELAVDVRQDEPRDLHQGDDEGALGQSSQMVAEGSQHR